MISGKKIEKPPLNEKIERQNLNRKKIKDWRGQKITHTFFVDLEN